MQGPAAAAAQGRQYVLLLHDLTVAGLLLLLLLLCARILLLLLLRLAAQGAVARPAADVLQSTEGCQQTTQRGEQDDPLRHPQQALCYRQAPAGTALLPHRRLEELYV